MSPLSCLPAYFVFGQQHLEVATCAARIAQYAADKAKESEHRALLVFLDQVLLHAISQVQEHVKQIQQVGLTVALALSHVPADGICVLPSSALYNTHSAGKRGCTHAVSSLCPVFCFCHQLRRTCDEPSASACKFTALLIAIASSVHPCPAVLTTSDKLHCILLQSYTNTLQIVFADVKSQNMEPHATASSEPATQPQPAPCSCTVSSKGSMPPSAPTSAGLPRQGTPAHVASPTSNEAEPDAAKTVSSTSLEHGLSSPTSESAAANPRAADSAHEQSSLEAYASLGTAGAEPHNHIDENAASSGQIAGYSWQLPPGVKQDACIMMWIGADDVSALTHLHLTFNK